jgi:lipopolysaccharide export system protein LptA
MYHDKHTLASLIFTLCCLISNSAWALSTDKDQPVSIEADSVDIDESTETAIYRGNVILIQGSINLNASRVVVHKFQSDNAHIEATGKQVQFSQKQDKTGELIKGRADKAEYGINSARLELTGDASLVKGNNTFKNDRIIYDREKAVVQAGSSAKGSERVKITIGGKK